MNNFKKIGLTALAGSLVAATAYAGEMSVAGSASMKVRHVDGGAANSGKAFSMGNQLTFSGSGELDNGLNISLSFVLDQGDDTNTVTAGAGTYTHGGTSPFDSHSVSISSDSLGTLKFAGEGGANVQTAIDTTAAGDLWDNGFGISSPAASDTASGMLLYTLPSVMDNVSAQVSYSPSGAAKESSTAFGLTYTGVEGLSVSVGTGELSTTTANASGDATTMKASYAMGSFTAAFSNTEVDLDGTGADDEVTSFKLSYTVSDDLSISYGEETHETSGQSIDEEVDSLSASYTTGGMTITAAQVNASGVDHAAGDKERWKLGVSFAF